MIFTYLWQFIVFYELFTVLCSGLCLLDLTVHSVTPVMCKSLEMSASSRVFQENRGEHTGTWATATQSYCSTRSTPFLLPPASRLFRGSVTYIPLPETRPCRGQAPTSAYTRRYPLTSAKQATVLDLRVDFLLWFYFGFDSVRKTEEEEIKTNKQTKKKSHLLKTTLFSGDKVTVLFLL